MLKRGELEAVYHDALDAGGVLRCTFFAIDSLEDALVGTPHVHVLGSIRSAVQAAERRVSGVAEVLELIEFKHRPELID